MSDAMTMQASTRAAKSGFGFLEVMGTESEAIYHTNLVREGIGSFLLDPPTISVTYALDAVSAWIYTLTGALPARAWDVTVAAHEVADAAAKVATPAEVLQYVHEASGLTWERLARVFSVSRRSVHLWASGSGMSAANFEALLGLRALVDSQRGATPDERRTQLLAADAHAASPLDTWARDYERARARVNSPSQVAADRLS